MPDPGDLDEEEEEEDVQEGNLPSLDPTLDNQYYGFLNVPRFPLLNIIEIWNIYSLKKCRTAEQAEITAAYKRLARLYHPDKHQVSFEHPSYP